MPNRTPALNVPDMPRLSAPKMPPLTSPRALTSDNNEASNSGSAGGAELITRALANTSQINGLGGKIDIVA